MYYGECNVVLFSAYESVNEGHVGAFLLFIAALQIALNRELAEERNLGPIKSTQAKWTRRTMSNGDKKTKDVASPSLYRQRVR